MPPKPLNPKVPGYSGADSEVSAQGDPESPRLTRSGRVVPAVPPTPRRARVQASQAEAEPSSSSSGPPRQPSLPSSSTEPGPGGTQVTAASEAAIRHGDAPSNASGNSQATAHTLAANASPSVTGPAASDNNAPRSRANSFSRSRSEHSATRNESVAPSSVDKGKVRATDVVSHGSSANSSSEVDSKTSSQPFVFQHGSNAGPSSPRAPAPVDSSAASIEVDSKPPSQLGDAVQSGATGAASIKSRSEMTLSELREATPLGGIHWSEIEKWLLTRQGEPPKVLCLFKNELLAIEGLQEPTDETEPATVLRCGHVFGERCMQEWIAGFDYEDELDGPGIATCPMCREPVGSSPLRRRRPDTSPSVSRPAQQRRRHQSPEDRIMQDADAPFGAQPASPHGQMPQAGGGGVAQEAPGRVRRVRKDIFIRDPERHDDQGQFVESPALLLGRLGMKGKMAVELPSLNPEYPACPRRYMVKCTDYDMTWGALRPLQKRDLARLKAIGKRERERSEEGWVPEVLSIISSPQYAAEVQANPFYVLQLRLPEGDEWHSKSDAFAAFGNLRLEMEDYWLMSGQKRPMKPRATHQREYLQQLGVQQGGEGALHEVDSMLAAVHRRLLSQTQDLERERLAARRRPEPRDAGAVEGEDLAAQNLGEEVERGRSRTRRP